jgi:hypothetical protein
MRLPFSLPSRLALLVLLLFALHVLWFDSTGKVDISNRDASPVISETVLKMRSEDFSSLPVLFSSSALQKSDSVTQAKVNDVYRGLPLSFEVNHGQVDRQVKFVSRGSGYTLFLTPTEAVLNLNRKKTEEGGQEDASPFENPEVRTAGPALHSVRQEISISEPRRQVPELEKEFISPESGKRSSKGRPKQKTISRLPSTDDSMAVRMKFVGANPEPRVVGMDEMSGKSNYFIGDDQTAWRTEVPHYARIKYQDIYSNVDLIYYGNQRQLEYDFIVYPGADPKVITLEFQGTDRLEVNPQGDLILHAADGQIRQHKPLVYQEVDGVKQTVAADYLFKDKYRIGFCVAAYDKSRPLIIDPVLSYSTYLGGSDSDFAQRVALDSAGNAYVMGTTLSTNFPTANPFKATRSGSSDVFVLKLNLDGNALIYSTYLGGSDSENSLTEGSIAVDSAGNVYITGDTSSKDFPKINPLPTEGTTTNAFVAKLNPAGSALVYSTYFTIDRLGFPTLGNNIAVDGSGNVYVTGQAVVSFGSDGIDFDILAFKLNPAGNGRVFSRLFQNSKDDVGNDITLDNQGNVYITGSVASSSTGKDVLLLKLSSTSGSQIFAVRFGGTGSESGNSIVVDSSGNIYVIGSTSSSSLPLVNPLQTAYGGGSSDAFIAKFGSTGTLLYSTYLGGSSSDSGNSIALDSAGNIYLTGSTSSTNFPTVMPLQDTIGGGSDVFVSKLNPTGSALLDSTYLGGDGSEGGNGIAVDKGGNIYVVGSTSSSNFPLANPLQASNGGGTDIFVAKMADMGFGLLVNPNIQNIAPGSSTSFTINVRGATGFTQPVSLSATVTPVESNVQISLSSNTVMPGGNATLTFNTTASTPTNRFIITITGNAGQLERKTTVVVNVRPDFALIIKPESQTVAPGASTSFTVDVQPMGNLTQPVSLSATVSPSNSNVTASFSVNSVTPGSNTTLTVSATASAPLNTIFNVTVTGKTIDLTRTKIVTVTVAMPDFALVFNPDTLSVTRGKKGQITVNISRTGGFTGNVNVTAPDTKAIKVKLTPPMQSTTGTSLVFNFKVKKTAPTGSQMLVFTGRDDSGRVRTGTLTLAIQ